MLVAAPQLSDIYLRSLSTRIKALQQKLFPAYHRRLGPTTILIFTLNFKKLALTHTRTVPQCSELHRLHRLQHQLRPGLHLTTCPRLCDHPVGVVVLRPSMGNR